MLLSFFYYSALKDLLAVTSNHPLVPWEVQESEGKSLILHFYGSVTRPEAFQMMPQLFLFSLLGLGWFGVTRVVSFACCFMHGVKQPFA